MPMLGDVVVEAEDLLPGMVIRFSDRSGKPPMLVVSVKQTIEKTAKRGFLFQKNEVALVLLGLDGLEEVTKLVPADTEYILGNAIEFMLELRAADKLRY